MSIALSRLLVTISVKTLKDHKPNPSSPPFDVVFVHGLTGSGVDTWRHPQSTQPWPQTLLHNSFPQARIMTFAYDADIVNFGRAASENRIDQHASNLVASLRNERLETGTKERPIYFICHSLGGLVVKNALWRSSSSPESGNRRIVDCTRGIAFMGTPHLGADSAKYLKFVLGFSKMLRPTNENIVGVLERDSEVLATITRSFHEMLRSRMNERRPEIKMACFAEELPVQRGPLSHTIVPRESAYIPGYEPYTIHADHINMTKFKDDNPDDPGYKLIKGQILSWLDSDDSSPQPSAANATRAAWTEGTASGHITQGPVTATGNTISSGGNTTIGNSASRR